VREVVVIVLGWGIKRGVNKFGESVDVSVKESILQSCRPVFFSGLIIYEFLLI
jgi:hypothetical protein